MRLATAVMRLVGGGARLDNSMPGPAKDVDGSENACTGNDDVARGVDVALGADVARGFDFARGVEVRFTAAAMRFVGGGSSLGNSMEGPGKDVSGSESSCTENDDVGRGVDVFCGVDCASGANGCPNNIRDGDVDDDEENDP